jgi:proteic killer suppression protein
VGPIGRIKERGALTAIQGHLLASLLTIVRYKRTIHICMIIRSVRHRGLLRLIEDDDGRELRSDLVRRLRNILAVLIAATDMSGVMGPPGWRIHQLRGDRAGTWSMSVSGNWRVTFDIQQGEICNLDLEDYH